MGISLARLEKHKEFHIWLSRSSKPSGVRQCIDAVHRVLLATTTPECPHPTFDSVTNWAYKMHLEGKKGGYINDYIKYARKYNRFLIETGKPHDPRVQEVKMFRETPPTKSTMSDEEIEQFLALPPAIYTRIRNGKEGTFVYDKSYSMYTMFFSVLAYSGMRPSEVASLKISDVDFGRNVFILRETKTNSPRLVPISPKVTDSLKKYMTDKTDYLFPAERSPTGMVQATGWGHQFHRRIDRMGIKRPNLTVYSLRHSFITRFLEQDVNIFKIQKIVGHKRIETTFQYTHLTTKDIQNAIQKDPLYTKNNPQGKLKYIKELLTGLLLDNSSGLNLNIDDTPTSVKFEASINDERS